MNTIYNIRDLVESDWSDIATILNYFAENSFAAYTEPPITIEKLKKMTEQVKIAVVLEFENTVIGFGYVSSYKPAPNFNRSGVLTYFILPQYTGKGIGTRLLNELITRGREAGIINYLAHISSKNLQSLNFHKKNGFEEVGRFRNIAYKFNELFDIVWMQKELKGYNE